MLFFCSASEQMMKKVEIGENPAISVRTCVIIVVGRPAYRNYNGVWRDDWGTARVERTINETFLILVGFSMTTELRRLNLSHELYRGRKEKNYAQNSGFI